MLVSNTMRFCTDIFGLIDSTDGEIIAPFNKQALLTAKTPLDCSNKSAVRNFVITGSQPSGTNRRVIFKINNALYKFSSGELVAYTGAGFVDDILSGGNTVAELNAMTSIPDFVGKKIYPIIALEAPSTAVDMPTIKMSLVAETSADTLTKVKESVVYSLTQDDGEPHIAKITADTTITGGASAEILVRLQKKDETWTDYMALTDAVDKEAVAVQFKITYRVGVTDGTDSAKVNSIVVDHTMGKTLVSGDNADLYSVVANYEIPLQMCYVVVRHMPLVDSGIEAYVNFMKAPKRRELIQIGTATGSRQELTLGVDGVADPTIDVSTIELYADDRQITDFDSNSEVSTVVISAKKNAIISASYNYDHDIEVWRKMTLERVEPYTDGETYMSRFTYTLPDSEATDKVISNVRLILKKDNGTVTNYSLGKATGKQQMFSLPHMPKASTIRFSDSSVDWSFNEDTQILRVVAAKNKDLKVSYSWVGEPINVLSFSAGWSVA